VAQNFNIAFYKKNKATNYINLLKLIFITAYVQVMMCQSYAEQYCLETTEELLFQFPEFQQLASDELDYLLKFRNAIKIAMLILPAEGHKGLLLQIAGKLEGSGRTYITGSGQTEGTKHRVMVYEREGNVKCEPRPPRKRQIIEEVQQGGTSCVSSDDDMCTTTGNSTPTEQNRISGMDYPSPKHTKTHNKLPQKKRKVDLSSALTASDNNNLTHFNLELLPANLFEANTLSTEEKRLLLEARYKKLLRVIEIEEEMAASAHFDVAVEALSQAKHAVFA